MKISGVHEGSSIISQSGLKVVFVNQVYFGGVHLIAKTMR